MPVWGTGPRRTDGRTNNPISAPLTYILPNQIPSLGLWLDSADLSTFVLSSISTVRIWRDKSQFGLHFSTNTGAPQLNFGSGVFFSGTRTDLMISLSSFTITNGNATIFAAGGPQSGPNYSLLGLGGGDFRVSLRFNNGSVDQNDIFWQSPNYLNGSVVPWFPSQGTPFLVDGIATNNSVFNPTYTSTISLSSKFLGRYYTGPIYEVLLFNSALDDTQRRGIEAYLARKWGIQNRLPFQHPGRPSQALAGYRLLNLSTILAVPSPYVWFDAMDTGRFTDVLGNTPAQNLTRIATWRDKSVNSLNFSNLGFLGTSPIFNLMGCNIYPELLSASGFTTFRAPTAGAQTVLDANAYKGSSISLFYVLTFNSGTQAPLHGFSSSFNNQTVISVSTTTDIILSHDGTNIQFSRIGSGQTSNNVIRAPLALSNKALVSIYVNGERSTIGNVLPSTNVIEINGSYVSSSSLFAGNPFNLQYLALFGGWNFVGQPNVNFSEIIQYNRVLTTPERNAIESQLIRKWQLPSNAPITYINNLPVTSGLFGWYDAYDDTTVLRNASNNVSMWLDKSGQSNHMSTNLLQFGSNTGSNIYYSSISISTNQYPSLFFPSTFAFMQTSTLITNQNMSSITMMAVKRGIKIPVSQNRTVSLFSTLGTFELGGGYIGATYNAVNNQIINNGQLTTNYSTFHINTLVANIGTATSNGVLASNAVVYYNGGNVQTTTGITYNGNMYPSYVRLMASAFSDQVNGDSRADAGYLGEVLLFNRILSSTELTNTHNYLLNKWGISNILSNVPVTSGLNLWLDAYDPACVITDSNSNVLLWRDKSGLSNHFSNFSLNYPILTRNPQANAPSISFNSNAITQALVNSNFNISSISSFSVLGVSLLSNTTVNGRIFSLISTSQTLDFQNDNGFNIFNNVGAGFGYTRSTVSLTASVSSNVNNMFSLIVNNSTIINDVTPSTTGFGTNGIMRAFSTATTTSTLNVNIAHIGTSRNNDATSKFSGLMCELLYYNRVLSFSERQQVESYLMSKWNI